MAPSPAAVDRYRRGQIRRNHTSTHLLNAALRQVVDPSIKQAGSLVAPGYLRFDFNYFEALKPEHVESLISILKERFDYVVLDLPRALVDWLAPLLDATDRMLLVTDSAVPSIRQARRNRPRRPPRRPPPHCRTAPLRRLEA